MNYYVIPTSIIESISYYIKGDVLSNHLSVNDSELFRTLNIDHIHANEGNVIETFLYLFDSALHDLESEGQREETFEDRDTLYEIISSLEKRKKAIEDITTDVLKKREDCCCY